MTTTLRLLAVWWWLQLKMRSRSAFDGLLSIVYPLFFATTVFLMYREGGDEAALIGAAVGASVMGVWSAVATTASTSLQQERRTGTLELLVAAPTPFPLVIVPMTLSMATIGLYSLVATLLWGRLAFGIPLSLAHPAAFVVASVVTAIGISLRGFLLAVTAVRYRGACALGTALELPVWLICRLPGAIVDPAQLDAADLLGAAPDVGSGGRQGRRAKRVALGRHRDVPTAVSGLRFGRRLAGRTASHLGARQRRAGPDLRGRP
ncbi:MAG TPA: ABC transporter permease [Actinomycetes bacterium]